jgi:hypothetical protein
MYAVLSVRFLLHVCFAEFSNFVISIFVLLITVARKRTGDSPTTRWVPESHSVSFLCWNHLSLACDIYRPFTIERYLFWVKKMFTFVVTSACLVLRRESRKLIVRDATINLAARERCFSTRDCVLYLRILIFVCRHTHRNNGSPSVRLCRNLFLQLQEQPTNSDSE